MKIEHFLFATLIALAGFYVTAADSSAYAQESTSTEKPSVKIYDKNNKLIKSLSQEEIELQMKASEQKKLSNEKTYSAAFATSTYWLSPATFSNYIWIRNGYGFMGPDSFNSEPDGMRIEVLELQVYGAASGTYYGKVTWQNTGYWISTGFEGLGLYQTRAYKFKLVNKGSQPVSLKNGYLDYN